LCYCVVTLYEFPLYQTESTRVVFLMQTYEIDR